MMRSIILIALAAALCAACGDSEADELGVGAECVSNDDCEQDPIAQRCLLQFKGGYCGVEQCVEDADCPEDAACITHDDGVNYCFRTCVDKLECNENRSVDNESNCSSNVTFAEGAMGRKACVPPTGN